MTNAELRSLIGDLRELVELCRDGEFYQDYDYSCEVLGRADRALNALSQIDRPVTHQWAGEPPEPAHSPDPHKWP